MIDQIIEYNKKFVAEKGYEKYVTDKYPDKKLAVLSCMDTRLSVLLQEALGLKNGDAKIIKNAGAVIPSPWDSAMRSLIVAVYELGVEEIMVVAHSNCTISRKRCWRGGFPRARCRTAVWTCTNGWRDSTTPKLPSAGPSPPLSSTP